MRNSGNLDEQPIVIPNYFGLNIIHKRLILLFFFILITNFSFGQLTELGFQIGAFNYTGDLSNGYEIKNHRPGGSVFLRTNLSDAVGLKYGLAAGLLHGSRQYMNQSEGQMTEISFNTTILEGFGAFEFYFLDYKSKHSKTHWTPYLSLGIGVFTYFGDAAVGSDNSRIQPAIPLGVGIKYQISKKIDIGFEASARATFFNYLDGIDENDPIGPEYVYGKKYNFDTYYFIGFTLNYTLFIIPCPYGYD
jgi:hypothetical protein